MAVSRYVYCWFIPHLLFTPVSEGSSSIKQSLGTWSITNDLDFWLYIFRCVWPQSLLCSDHCLRSVVGFVVARILCGGLCYILCVCPLALSPLHSSAHSRVTWTTIAFGLTIFFFIDLPALTSIWVLALPSILLIAFVAQIALHLAMVAECAHSVIHCFTSMSLQPHLSLGGLHRVPDSPSTVLTNWPSPDQRPISQGFNISLSHRWSAVWLAPAPVTVLSQSTWPSYKSPASICTVHIPFLTNHCL